MRLKTTLPSKSTSLRAEMYSLKASGCTWVIMLLRAWMPSKITTSSFFSLMDLEGSCTRIRRENSYFGTNTRSPRESMVKCRFSSSISMHRGDSRSSWPSGVRGVFSSMVLK